MNWFSGSIPEAIGLAKSTDAVFVVYIHDSSEATTATDATLAEDGMAAVLNSKKFVAIKLENGTESSNQFAQIYPVVVLPSLYFISGSTGIPLEILAGAVTKEKLKEKLDQFTGSSEVASDKPQQETPGSAPEDMVVDEPNVPEPTPSVSEPTPSVSVVNAENSPQSTSSNPSSSSPAASPMVSENATDNAEQEKPQPMLEDEDDNDDSSMSVDDKVERAKVLLAEKQAKISEEKSDDKKRQEVERRKMGQEVAKRKRQVHDEEIQTAARERKKEKEEDRAARERVKAQIAADRLERETRAAMLQGGAPAPAQEPSVNVPPPAAANRNATVSRLKFRLPDGSSSIAQFPVETTLGAVRQHVEQQLLSSTNFMLSSTVHHRPFNSEDNESSILELGLVPSAIIVVLLGNRSSTGGGVVSSQGGIMQFLWILLSPITFLLGFVRQIFSGGSSTPRPSSSSGAQTTSGQTTTQQRPSSSYGRPQDRLNREGNIYRLRNSNDDEDNNTWNGNSTQQM